MKKSLSLVLAIVFVLSAFSLASCAKKPKFNLPEGYKQFISTCDYAGIEFSVAVPEYKGIEQRTDNRAIKSYVNIQNFLTIDLVGEGNYEDEIDISQFLTFADEKLKESTVSTQGGEKVDINGLEAYKIPQETSGDKKSVKYLYFFFISFLRHPSAGVSITTGCTARGLTACRL